MTDTRNNNLIAQPIWLRTIAAIGVLWFLFGFSQFVKNVTMDVASAVAKGAITEAHGAAITATPALIWVAYFIACLAGLIGAVQLFRGHASAIMLFVLSLVLDVIYFGWIRFLSGAASDRPAEAGIIAIVVISITVAFTLLSLRRFRT